MGSCGALFSFAMGLSAVAIPLYALARGITAAEIGMLVAFSAAAQLAMRSVMGRLLRRVADKHFIVAAGALMAMSCALLVGSPAWWAFLLSQVAQGAARGVFWTGGQVHVVRTHDSSVTAIARMNLTSGVGQTLGPLAAGPLIAHGSALWALGVAALAALAAMIPAALLVRLDPPRPARRTKAGQHRPGAADVAPGVGLASWAGAVAGAWRSMMNSFVPVVLAEVGHAAPAIGAVTAAANLASIAGSSVVTWIRLARLAPVLVLSIALTGVGLAGFAGLAQWLGAAAVALFVSGIAAGLLQTAGPALASESVLVDERGEALAKAGTYRAAALLAAPLLVSGLVGLMATPMAVVVLGGLMAGPVVLARGRSSPTMEPKEGEP
ncbi:MAG: arabinose efflux permease family protein [Nocardioides sp.]|nr:arabinose efflux permease family protein [Nocardioides sp.]